MSGQEKESKTKISIKNIEAQNPALHDFIIDYWKFAVQYTPASSGEEWWESVFSDVNYYTDKYAGDIFICDLLVMQLEAMTSKYYRNFSKAVMLDFLKDWGRFLNDYVYSARDEGYWDRLTDEANRLCDKYRGTSFFQELLNRSVYVLCGQVHENDFEEALT